MSESVPSTLALFRRFAAVPMGRQLFTRAICLKAPYFSSIHPLVKEMRPEYAEVHIRKRRSVTNHLGTVHAIAMCNMAELAAGMLMEATVPSTHRWIPKGMSVEYLQKAETALKAVAMPEAGSAFGAAADYLVSVELSDTAGQPVFRASIKMWVSPKKK
jgi:acyl-coenzyme A thioesterase PaaI-like protein